MLPSMKRRDEEDSPVIFQVTKSVKLQITQCCDFTNVLKMYQLHFSVNLCTNDIARIILKGKASVCLVLNVGSRRIRRMVKKW